MSASLVGSEMCIRDSSGSGKGRCVRTLMPPALFIGGLIWKSTLALRGGCLLYTSDAADDM
eukprot:3132907-Alexandrium_andersonii.AAC.1